ncbi:MAG: MerR family transcriptional regulator [Myxococcus sp.]|nr:MerR family transcriptional regulator [Myxococcus sp.]
MKRTYRINVAAEMSGVSEGLIRAWERRYGVLKPKRTPSGYRAYTPADVAVLKRLKQVTSEGVSIAEAVKLLPLIKREVKELHAAASSRSIPRAPKAGKSEKWRHDMLVAAQRLDQQALEAVLDEAVASLPPVALWDEVLAPLQREVGERWHQGTFTIAEEHLVTQAVKQCVLTLLHQAPRRSKRHVVCACFPDEDHELGLLAAALRFRHAGWRVTFLGARTPAEHLARVVRVVRPQVVALSSVNDEGAEHFEQTLTELTRERGDDASFVVGGRGAEQHAKLAAKLGVRLVTTPEGWDALLGRGSLAGEPGVSEDAAGLRDGGRARELDDQAP